MLYEPSRTPRWSAFLLSLCLLGPLFLSAPGPVQAQDDLERRRSETEKRLESLQQQIEQSKERLQEVAEEERATQDRLEQLRREIAVREKLVRTYQRRLREVANERGRLRDTMETMQTRLDDLRAEYRGRVQHAYKYNRIPDLALLLASRSINQMLVRARYLQRFAQQRKAQRAKVRQAAKEVRASQKELEAKRNETERLLEEARIERQNLKALKEDRENLIADLRSRQSELEAELEEKQQQARQMEKQLRRLSAEIAERGEDASAERAASAAALSANFEQNRGHLPWPVEGAVTERFGNHVDPVHGTQTYHPGIFIATQPQTEVRAVFAGTVSGVDFVPGYGTYLVLRHGEYLSVYSNLSELDVTEGDQVSAGQRLGLSGTENEPRGAGLFFAVFDRSEDTSVDPTAWLANR